MRNTARMLSEGNVSDAATKKKIQRSKKERERNVKFMSQTAKATVAADGKLHSSRHPHLVRHLRLRMNYLGNASALPADANEGKRFTLSFAHALSPGLTVPQLEQMQVHSLPAPPLAWVVEIPPPSEQL